MPFNGKVCPTVDRRQSKGGMRDGAVGGWGGNGHQGGIHVMRLLWEHQYQEEAGGNSALMRITPSMRRTGRPCCGQYGMRGQFCAFYIQLLPPLGHTSGEELGRRSMPLL